MVSCLALVWLLWVTPCRTHLLFPDDALVLCDVVLDQILLLRLMLLWFEIVSRLKINMGKSELGPVGVVPN